MAFEGGGSSMVIPTFDPATLVGRTLAGRYRILDIVGSGGMGTVFKGQHISLERVVAVKVMSPQCLLVPNIKERFAREARVTNRIAHRNVLDVEDIGETDEGLPYQVMEFLNGETLYERTRRAPISIAELLEATMQICLGLAAAHDIGIVHRDISPANVFLIRRGTVGVSAPVVKILDFGIAFVTAEQRLTLPGQVLGTPRYVAPELVVGGDVTPAVDIYSLGAVLYEALAGRPVFDDPNVATLAMMHVTKDPTPLQELRPKVSSRLAALVMRCLEKQAADRPESARAVGDEIRAVMRELAIPVRRSAPPVAGVPSTLVGGRAPATPAPASQPGGASLSAWKGWVEQAKVRGGRVPGKAGLTQIRRLEAAIGEIEKLDRVVPERAALLAEIEERRAAAQERFARALETLYQEEVKLTEALARHAAEFEQASGQLDQCRKTLAAARKQIAAAEEEARLGRTLVATGGSSDETMDEALLRGFRAAGEAAATYERAAAVERAARRAKLDCEEQLRDARFQCDELNRNSERQMAAIAAESDAVQAEITKDEDRRAELYRVLIESAGALAAPG
jgi:tRNA A-37 threonylcarbamoyl transferase component Bud32